MKSSVRVILVTLTGFAGYYFLQEFFFRGIRNAFDPFLNQRGISHLLTYILVGLPIFAGAVFLHGKKWAESLGLNRSPGKAFIFALLCTLPMLIGYAGLSSPNPEFTLNTFLIKALAAGFFEELYFRGFLFGQLFRYTRLGFLPAVLIGALLFASVHLYQSDDQLTLVGIFAVTLLGAVIFAWVYAEWNYNIWVPVFLHLLMNLFWDIFSGGANALGGLTANIFRLGTIILIITLTIIYKKRRGEPLEITRKTIWMKRENQYNGR
jgi:membrane protease YdiL (CAAX protease family)